MGRFLAILIMVALGAGFFAGLNASANDMRASADTFYDSSRMMDIRLLSTLGFTKEDIDAVSAIEGVESVMAGYFLDAETRVDGESQVVRLHSLPNDCSEENSGFINRPTLRSGRLPSASGECLLGLSSFTRNSVQLGDYITLENNDGELSDMLSCTKFRVVGFCDSSYYICNVYGTSSIGNGNVKYYMYIGEDDFSVEAFTDVYVKVKDADELNCYSDEYSELVGEIVDRIENIAGERADMRFEGIYADARAELDDGWKEYYDGKKEADEELADALRQIEDGQKEIDNNRIKLDSAVSALDDAQSQLDEGWEEYNAAKAEYDAGAGAIKYLETVCSSSRVQINAAQQELNSQKDSLETMKAAGLVNDAQYAAAMVKINAAQDELDAKTQELAVYEKQVSDYYAGGEKLEETYAQLSAGEAKIKENRAALRNGSAALRDAERELADARKEYDDAKREAEEELTEALEELENGERELAELESGEWYVLDRDANYGFVSYKSDCDRMESLSGVFPLMFFLVAALVALTTMTRMVDEERSVIGTYKAVGYSDARIMGRYLLCALIASFVGSTIGVLIGFETLPRVINDAYSMLYKVPDFQTNFYVKYALAGSLSVTLCTLAATYFACRSALSENPASLMQPRAPKPGKRILLERVGFIWKKLGFTTKVTYRNIFRYKKRLVMTLTGIAGCTALLVTGFGLKDSISDIINNQFEVIYNYNLQLETDGKPLSAELVDILDDSDAVTDWQRVAQKAADARSESGKNMTVYVLTPERAESLSDFITLKDRRSGREVTFNENSVILTEKAAKEMDVRPGDTISVEMDEGRRCDFTVTDIAENYVYHYLYVAPQKYFDVTGEEPVYNGVQAMYNDNGEIGSKELSDRIMQCSGVNTAAYVSDVSDQFDDMLECLNYVMIVLILCAAALACVVLYNLTNINVNERKRELATLKVLGFTENETSAYIFRETILLALMGCILGLGLGVLMHSFVITTVEVDMVMFGRIIKAPSFLWSGLLTMLFSVAVTMIMRPKIGSIDMVDSLKSVE